MTQASPTAPNNRYILRETFLFAGIAILFGLIFVTLGPAYGMRMVAEALCYTVLALGLTAQWGYAGLFNVGILGFAASGAFMTVLLSFPLNEAFWSTDLPQRLGDALLRISGFVLVTLALSQIHRLGLSKRLRNWVTTLGVLITFVYTTNTLEPITNDIETTAYFIGGFGLPVWIGWIGGGIAAGCLAWVIGKICLGLRSDYLAIATLGIAEIVKTFLKNADWLTRGTLTVSPIPWPVPTPNEIGFVASRASYAALVAIAIVLFYFLLQRAYHAPWGRMMRAIRDNETAASSMGKDINRRRLEVFVFGSVLMGIGGAMLITFARIFDPAGFIPLNHTFLVWVMVILGGSGNNRGAIFGALFVYIVWTMSEPMALLLFDYARIVGEALFGWQAPSDLDSRALQMRVFVIGLTITLVLRLAPQGVFPERTSEH